MKPLSNRLSRQNTAAKSLLIPSPPLVPQEDFLRGVRGGSLISRDLGCSSPDKGRPGGVSVFSFKTPSRFSKDREQNLGQLAACLVAALTCTAPQAAEIVACNVSYGGTTQILEARPTTTPYELAPVAIGSYFLFRIVFRQEPADLAGIKLHAYVDRDSGPALIHQASYTYPITTATTHGFTGLHHVYEPVRDSELQYWCEQKAETGK